MNRARRIVHFVAGSAIAFGGALPGAGFAEAAVLPMISQSDVSELTRLARGFLADRTEALVTHGAGGKFETTLLQHETAGELRFAENLRRQVLAARRGVLDRAGERYAASRVGVVLSNVRLDGQSARADALESTVLDYARVAPDDPEFTAFEVRHEFTFAREANGRRWVVVDERAVEPESILSINQVGSDPDRELAGLHSMFIEAEPAPDARRTARKQQATPLSFAYLNYDAIAAYAEKYWSNYNPNYRRFDGGAGGDCTNFISQALSWGGWAHVLGGHTSLNAWWYDKWATQTYTWVGAHQWSSFATQSGRVYRLINPGDMGKGDILQMDFDRDGKMDHSMVVSYVSSRYLPYLTYHTASTFRRTLTSIRASYPNAILYAWRT